MKCRKRFFIPSILGLCKGGIKLDVREFFRSVCLFWVFYYVSFIYCLCSSPQCGKYKNYLALSSKALALYKGKILSRGGASVGVEGIDTLPGGILPNRVVVVEFANTHAALDFYNSYNSPEYTEARNLRKDAASAIIVVTEGVETTPLEHAAI